MTRDEFLLRDFLVSWLFAAYESGVARIRSEELHSYLREIGGRGGQTEHAWSEPTLRRVAVALLGIAADFGLLRGTTWKEFVPYHVPEVSFLYLVHAISEQEPSPHKLIESSEWRIFRLRGLDVERELLRLHQYRKLHYEVAGTLAQLTLPYPSLAACAEGLAV